MLRYISIPALMGRRPDVIVLQDEETRSITSDFLYSADGWNKAGKDAGRVEMLHAPMLVQGRDDGDYSWWFAAPPKFLGDQGMMYGGKISLRVGFWEYNGSFMNSSATQNTYDVVLTSESAGISLGRAGLLVPHAFINSIEVNLHERDGWVVDGTAGAPSKHDMQRVLSTLSRLWVRGGFYAGPEETYIMSVRLSPVSSQTPPDGAARKPESHEAHAEETEDRRGGVGEGGGGAEEGESSCQSLRRLEGAQLLEGKHGCVISPLPLP